MSMNVPALKIDFEKISENFQQGLIGPNEKVTGNTGTHYQGLGVADNAANADDIAAFFSTYATEKPETYFQQIDIFSDKGQAFLSDLQKYSASINDDGYLSVDELQSWADQNKYRGDINKVMEVLADVDKLLFGKGTMDIEYVNPEDLEPAPTEETQPEEVPTEETEPETQQEDDESSSLKGLIKGAVEGFVGWMANGLQGLGNWLFG